MESIQDKVKSEYESDFNFELGVKEGRKKTLEGVFKKVKYALETFMWDDEKDTFENRKRLNEVILLIEHYYP
jgi:C4-type Zn-finger protein